MKEKFAAILALFLAFASCSCAFRTETASYDGLDEKIVLRFAESMPAEHPSAMASQAFADMVREQSDGRIDIHVQYDGALGSEQEALEQLRFGGIAFARLNVLSLVDEITLLEHYTFPFQYASADEVMAAIEFDMEHIKKALSREQMIPLAFLYPDRRCIVNNIRPLRSLADLKDLRICTPQSKVLSRFVSNIGAVPITVKETSIMRSLNSGFVDGAEMTLLEYTQGNHDEFMSYCTFTSSVFCPDVILAGSVSIGGLNSSDQALIIRCGQEVLSSHKQQLAAAQERALEGMAARGQQPEDGKQLDSEARGLLGANF